jgi:exodeoxyribonuclease VIII
MTTATTTPEFSNCMLDLETLGKKPGCIIVSIGAVLFNREKLGPEFYTVIDVESCVEMGLTMDASTVMWWMMQSQEAREMIGKPKITGSTISQALCSFSTWLRHFDPDCATKVWGNGAAFDNAIMAAAYDACKLPMPWKFWNDRCYRTVKGICPEVEIVRKGTHHNALHDAKNQAEHLIHLAPQINLFL